jgi:protein-S-isoprenylcysteine O-methyltransferase Ste14
MRRRTRRPSDDATITGMDAPLRHRGTLLVAAQFALILALGVIGVAGLLQGLSSLRGGVATVLLAAAAGLGAWTLQANRPGNFNIHPRPREGGALITHGPYRHIRHPMYTTVLLGSAAAVPAASTGWIAAVLWAALAVVLSLKAGLEERWMRTVHPGYDAYAASVRRFVPGWF